MIVKLTKAYLMVGSRPAGAPRRSGYEDVSPYVSASAGTMNGELVAHTLSGAVVDFPQVKRDGKIARTIKQKLVASGVWLYRASDVARDIELAESSSHTVLARNRVARRKQAFASQNIADDAIVRIIVGDETHGWYENSTPLTSAFISELPATLHARLVAALPGDIAGVSREMYISALQWVKLDALVEACHAPISKGLIERSGQTVLSIAALFNVIRGANEQCSTMEYIDRYGADVALLGAAVVNGRLNADAFIDPTDQPVDIVEAISSLSGVTQSIGRDDGLRLISRFFRGDGESVIDGLTDVELLFSPLSTIEQQGAHVLLKRGTHQATLLNVNANAISALRDGLLKAVTVGYAALYDREAPHLLAWSGINHVVHVPARGGK